MKYTQKTKYFAFGAVACAVLAPLAIYAVETIPISFGEGDVISAGVINSMLKRMNDTQRGYENVDELVGTYSCKTHDNNGHQMCPSGNFVASNGIYTATQIVEFAKTGSNLTFTAKDVAPGGCGHNALGHKTGTLTLMGGTMVANSVTGGWQDIRRLSPTKLKWDSGLPYAFSECTLVSTPPAPANALAAKSNGKNVALDWVDQSNNETGFKVQHKSSSNGSWVTVTTTAPNATSYTVAGLSSGKYWFRIVAVNGNGEAMSSSEIQADAQ